MALNSSKLLAIFFLATSLSSILDDCNRSEFFLKLIVSIFYTYS